MRFQMIEEPANRLPVLFVGFAIPEELMSSLTAKDMYPQAQGHQHQWSLIRGIESVTGYPIELISVAALGDWPRHPARFVKGGVWSHAPGARDVMVSFINISPWKQITRFVAVGCHIKKWLYRHRRSSRPVIFLYSSQSSQLWALLISTAFVPLLRIAIMPDPPSVDVPGEGRVRRLARRADRWLQRQGLKKMDGVVVLAKALADDFAAGVPCCVSEGIAPELPMAPPKAKSAPFIAMYAGGLIAEYGVRLILDCASLLPPGIELWLFGRGLLLGEAQSRAAQCPSLRVFGFCPRDEVVRKAAEAMVMLNPRSTSAWFVRYSFPSKILECMASGTPLLSTRLPTIPEDYGPFIFWLDNESPEGLARRLVELRDLGSEALRAKGFQAREFVREHKSEAAQGRHIWAFVSELLKNQP
jgi:glycosyltransferase involved in cell wall biosynthesis